MRECIRRALFYVPMDVIKTLGLRPTYGPTITTVERHKRDEMSMAHKYVLDMLHHMNGWRASTHEMFLEGENKY